MKKKPHRIIIAIIFIIIVIILLLIRNLVVHGPLKEEKDFKEIEKYFLTQKDVKNVNSVDEFIGKERYYVITYVDKSDTLKIAFLDLEKKLIYNIEQTKLIDEKKILYEHSIKGDYDLTIGYEEKRVIYEIKENIDNYYNYYYFDAINGDLIRSYKIKDR